MYVIEEILVCERESNKSSSYLQVEMGKGLIEENEEYEDSLV